LSGSKRPVRSTGLQARSAAQAPEADGELLRITDRKIVAIGRLVADSERLARMDLTVLDD